MHATTAASHDPSLCAPCMPLSKSVEVSADYLTRLICVHRVGL